MTFQAIPPGSGRAPQRLLRNADVVTMDPAMPTAEAVGIDGDRIVAVGSFADVRSRLAGDVEETDLRGATVVPGFVDGHCHLEMTCQARDHHVFVQSPPVTSLAEIDEKIAGAREHRPTGWLIARGSFMLQDKVRERRLPGREELDRVSPGAPVVVLAGLHVACLNSAALQELGLLTATETPRWMTLHRDANGQPTGVVTEIWDRLPTLDVATVIASLRNHAGPMFAANGVTTVCTIPTSAEDVRALQKMANSGELPVRARYYVHVPRIGSLDTVLAWGPGSGFGDDRLRFGGIKIFVDGEGADGLGHAVDDTKWTREELFDFVRRADEAEIQLMMHAVTPSTIRLAAEAVEAVAEARERRKGHPGPRHRIEHGADYLDVADLPWLRRTGVGLVATPHFAASAGVSEPMFQPLRTILDAGVPVIGSSDSTGTVPDSVSPLYNIHVAVNRVDGSGASSPQRVTPVEALRMYTTASAYGCHEEDRIGILRPGALADLAVLSDNPLRVSPDRIGTIDVLATLLGGEFVHAAEGWHP